MDKQHSSKQYFLHWSLMVVTGAKSPRLLLTVNVYPVILKPTAAIRIETFHLRLHIKG